MQVETNYTDSHGQSEIGFAITRLLGFDLLPLIKRINHLKVYRTGPGEAGAWPGLAPAMMGRAISWDLSPSSTTRRSNTRRRPEDGAVLSTDRGRGQLRGEAAHRDGVGVPQVCARQR